jgi:hypothetical protein
MVAALSIVVQWDVMWVSPATLNRDPDLTSSG